MKRTLAPIALAAGIAAGVASANGSPYSPGLVYGWNGVGAGDGVRYVAFGMPKSTIHCHHMSSNTASACGGVSTTIGPDVRSTMPTK